MSDELKAAQEELNDEVLGHPGVAGTGIGLDDGKPCLKVYLSSEQGGRDLPARVRGFPVVPEKTGPFRPREG